MSGRRRRSTRVGDPHLKLVKSDGVFQELARKQLADHLEEMRAARRAQQCGGVHELQRTPSGGYINPEFWIPLRCTAAPEHIGHCIDEVGILFRKASTIPGLDDPGAVMDWGGYEDSDIYDLAMAIRAEGGK